MQLNDDGTILIDIGPDDINSDGSFDVPEGVLGIGNEAFYGCTVTLPEGLHTIGTGAFSGCGELKTVTFPEGLLTIGNGAFARCGQLEAVTIPQNRYDFARSEQTCRNRTRATFNLWRWRVNSGNLDVPEFLTR